MNESEKQRNIDKVKEANKQRMAEKKKEAEAAVELMGALYERICIDEKNKKGLIITKATYGKLSDGELDEDAIPGDYIKSTITHSMDFNVNYDISDKSWWNPEYTCHVTTVEVLLKHYTEYKSRIKVAFVNVDNKLYFDDYSEYHCSHYLLETLIGEGNIDGSTTMQELEKYLKVPDDSKMFNKIKNLKNSMHKLFPNFFEFVNCRSKVVAERFTPTFIQQLHENVTVDLVETPGVYRKKWTAPSQENWMYLAPQKIANSLNKLCVCVRREIQKEEDYAMSDEEILVGRIKIVATFLTEFLQIHPFTNGNGRVARLLISWLMIDLSVVPVPLMTSSTSRDIYLQCLRETRHTTPILPIDLARLILESVVNTVRIVCYAIDI